VTQRFAELLLLVPSALCAGLLIFVAEVLQQVMNDLDEATFKRLVMILYRRAVRAVFLIILSSVTFVGMIPYFYFYGFSNRWFTAGLALFTLSSIVSKILNLPIYHRVVALGSKDAAELREERVKLQRANIIRATLCFASVVLMAAGIAWASGPAPNL
jgi:uncharacterized membrane protein